MVVGVQSYVLFVPVVIQSLLEEDHMVIEEVLPLQTIQTSSCTSSLGLLVSLESPRTLGRSSEVFPSREPRPQMWRFWPSSQLQTEHHQCSSVKSVGEVVHLLTDGSLSDSKSTWWCHSEYVRFWRESVNSAETWDRLLSPWWWTLSLGSEAPPAAEA